MNATQKRSRAMLSVLVVVSLSAIAQPAHAIVYDLRAASTTVTMSDGTVVPMWGFGLMSEPTVSVPGPVLDVPVGDDTLIVNLRNDLSVPVSIVIPGIPAPLTPVWDDGTTGPRTSLQQRAVSFTHVALPGETVQYQWSGVQPGTYLYHSGTHAAVQVPMGLYGAVRHEATDGETYGVSYDDDLVLVYSEVDPALNAAVTGGTYGTPAYPSTIGYRPRYFLVNGQETTSPPELTQGVNERLLLRVVNAGLRTIVPTLTVGSMTLVAEDGHAAPFARHGYSMLMPAGKTRDALLVLTEETETVLFDRRGASRLAQVAAAPVAGAPVATADPYTTPEDTPLDTVLAGLAGVLANDVGTGLTAVLYSDTSAGTLDLRLDGSFVYTPAPDFAGIDTFRYQATDGTLSSSVVTVSIEVTPVNDPPAGVDDAFEATEGTSLVVAAPGVLANDLDVDSPSLTAQLATGPSGGSLVFQSDGSFEYSAAPGTVADSFTYQVSDGVALSAPATVSITIVPFVNAAPVAVDDYATTQRNTPVLIDVVANDTDADGVIDPGTVVVTSDPTRGGTATVVGGGQVEYAPRLNFRGTDTFTYAVRDDRGELSAPATVHVNVIR